MCVQMNNKDLDLGRFINENNSGRQACVPSPAKVKNSELDSDQYRTLGGAISLDCLFGMSGLNSLRVER